MLLDTITADLKPIDPYSITSEVIVKSYYPFTGVGDGGGGVFYFDGSILKTSENGGFIIKSTYDASLYGCWVRIYNGGPINVRWFGAKGDGTTDDTTVVHKARDAAYNGSLYFPVGTYVGAFEFLAATEEINIIGDGQGTVLKSNGTSSGGNHNPVLRLGYRGPNVWRNAKVSNLVIDGGSGTSNPRFSDGVMYDDTTNRELSGRWDFEKVTFTNCNRGIYKPTGNIGNSYTNCLWYDNNYGYWGQGGLAPHFMHVGCERFIGGQMNSNDFAAIYFYGENDGTGQIILDGIIIEGNAGFGIFVRFLYLSQLMVNAICLRNVWFELNGGHIVEDQEHDFWLDNDILIDSNYYSGRDMYFEGVRSVRIDDGIVNRITLYRSSVNLYNCRSDNAGFGYKVDVDYQSSLVAYELRYNFQPSDNIYVNSISYDGTAEPNIGNNLKTGTSVWGPLRVITQTGTTNKLVSQRYNNIALCSFPSGNYPTVVDGGILNDKCLSLTLASNNTIRDSLNFFDMDEHMKYYVWSIHSFACLNEENNNSVYGLIESDNGIALGQVFFKAGQWVCSYGIKHMFSDQGTVKIYLYLFGGANGGKVMFCDYQVVAFDNYYDACSFVNSKAFAENLPSCKNE